MIKNFLIFDARGLWVGALRLGRRPKEAHAGIKVLFYKVKSSQSKGPQIAHNSL